MHGFKELIMYSPTAAGPNPAKPDPSERLRRSEVSVRPFNPESIEDLADLHDIDLDTRDSTIDVTDAPSEISPEDLKEWMKDPLLLAMVQNGRAFGFAWPTLDTNVKRMEIQHVLSAMGDFSVHNVMEYSHGELKGINTKVVQMGLMRSLDHYASTMEEPPVLTAYTTDPLEGELLQSVGFRPFGTVPAYYAEMDDGSVKMVDEPHMLLAIDLTDLVRPQHSAWVDSKIGARNRARSKKG